MRHQRSIDRDNFRFMVNSRISLLDFLFDPVDNGIFAHDDGIFGLEAFLLTVRIPYQHKPDDVGDDIKQYDGPFDYAIKCGNIPWHNGNVHQHSNTIS
ncbi:hypothetical protein COL940_009025 [Colletotrichum noveboracense]|nr:hypothetical protein COL940_009025 [Colletotrichum noveboracense]